MKSEKQVPIMLGQSSPDMKDNKFDLILNPISLSEFQKKVLQLIPVGKDHAVGQGYIAKLLNVDPRNITKTIREIRLQRICICSLRGVNAGYYQPANAAEYAEGMQMLISTYKQLEKVIKMQMLTPYGLSRYQILPTTKETMEHFLKEADLSNGKF